MIGIGEIKTSTNVVLNTIRVAITYLNVWQVNPIVSMVAGKGAHSATDCTHLQVQERGLRMTKAKAVRKNKNNR